MSVTMGWNDEQVLPSTPWGKAATTSAPLVVAPNEDMIKKFFKSESWNEEFAIGGEISTMMRDFP